MAISKVYFTQFEKELVLSLTKPHLNLIENKETNAVICSKKNEIFKEITRQFNYTDGVVNPRTSQQIRQCYLNLKKKLTKKRNVIRQERRKSGGGEVSEETELKDGEMRFLGEPQLTLSMLTPLDSDSTEAEISKSQDSFSNASTSDPFVLPVTPSQGTSAKASTLNNPFDPSIVECWSNAETPLKAEIPKPTSEPTAPSAAARAAACIEVEHLQTMKYMEREEIRKEKRAEAENKEHELRMELLREQIKLTKTKTKFHEKLVSTLEENPKLFFQNHIKIG
ncbi:myb_DNA-bind_5 domain-containing protein [Nephila pilipes]|uniref:Regulatory protein zeste n=1 Tax=Nephila pilipes TaxID=299642 RepID=A0A8X6MPJ8_NEPPI|nr:myb_DNA-bind_5 domain-containing protein [Nephila pilipes]